MKTKNRNRAAISSVFIGVIVAMLLITQVGDLAVKETRIEPVPKKWTLVAGPSPVAYVTGSAGGVSNSGITAVCIFEHWANGSYNSNITENYTTNVYAYHSTGYNRTLGGNVPSGTAFDIIITVKIDNTLLYNGTVPQMGVGSAVLTTDWLRMNMTSPHTSPALGGLTAASGRRNVTNGGAGNVGGIEGYYNFYWNNSGNGFTLGSGVSANITAFTFEIYQ